MIIKQGSTKLTASNCHSLIVILLTTMVILYPTSGNSTTYGVLKKIVDQSYYLSTDGFVYFIFDGEYNNGSLNYSIYDINRNVAFSDQDFPINIKHDTNLYSLNIGCSLTNNAYYTLEVTDQRNVVWKLKFKYTKPLNCIGSECEN